MMHNCSEMFADVQAESVEAVPHAAALSRNVGVSAYEKPSEVRGRRERMWKFNKTRRDRARFGATIFG